MGRTWRDDLYEWLIFSVMKHPKGKIAPWHVKMIRAILFPVKWLKYSIIESGDGYKWERDVYVINGLVYPSSLFSYMSKIKDGQQVIITKENGTINFEQQREA